MGVFWLTSREESRPIHCIVIVFVPNAHCSSSRFCCVTCAFCVSSLSRLCVERRDDQLVWLPAPHAAAYTRPSPPRPSDIQPTASQSVMQSRPSRQAAVWPSWHIWYASQPDAPPSIYVYCALRARLPRWSPCPPPAWHPRLLWK